MSLKKTRHTKTGFETYHKKRWYSSFYHAGHGVWHAIEAERNVRIHLVVAAFVLQGAGLYRLPLAHYPVLFLSIGMVLSLELFNTAVEAVVDLHGKRHTVFGRIAKDTAAGAVLVSAVVAVGVGISLFSEIDRWIFVVHTLCADPLRLTLLTTQLFVGGFFIFGWRSSKEDKE